MKHKLLKSALCLFLLLPACNNDKDDNTTSGSTAETTAATPAPTVAVTQQQAKTVSGTVLETMDAGGYTYLLIETGKTKQWVAIAATEVKTGETVSYYDGMVMPNFTSKSLNKTFDSIIFSPGLVGQEPPAADPHGIGKTMDNDTPATPAAPADADNSPGADPFASAVQAEASPATMQAKTVSGGSIGAMVPFDEIKVEKATGDNAYTVGELFADNTKLDGKTVRVQGKVVKFSPQIMGMNWIHLQDGSGDPLKNTHDLVVTTSLELPKDQEVITIEGIVRANKDFGAGYSYVVIVEEAKIVQ